MDDFARVEELKKLKIIYSQNRVFAENLFLKDKDGQDFFEYIITNQIKIQDDDLIHYISNNEELLRRAANKGYFLSRYDNVDLLFQGPGETIIETLFRNRNGVKPNLSLDIINRMFTKVNGRYIIDDILSIADGFVQEFIIKVSDFNILYECLKNIGRLDLMIDAKEKFLTTITPNGIPTLQEIIDTKVFIEKWYPEDPELDIVDLLPGDRVVKDKEVTVILSELDIDIAGLRLGNSRVVKDKEIAAILYKNEEYKLLMNLNGHLLVNYPTPTDNYLMAVYQKNRGHLNFETHGYKKGDNRLLARTCLTLLEKGADLAELSYILKNPAPGKPILTYMLELNYDLTVEHFKKCNDSSLQEHLKDGVIDCIAKIYNRPKDSLKTVDITEFLGLLPKKENMFAIIKQNPWMTIEPYIFDVENFLEPVDGNISLLEYLIKKGNGWINAFGTFNDYMEELLTNIQAVIIMVNCNYQIDRLEEAMLYEDIEGNQKLIDLLITKKYYNCILKSSHEDVRVVDYCIKYNCFNILSNDILEELFVEHNGHFLVENYLNNPKFLDFIIDKIKSKNFFVNGTNLRKLYEFGYTQLIQFANEETLLEENNGKTFLEQLLQSGQIPSFGNYELHSLKTVEILYQYQKPELMCQASLRLLMDYPSKENNYLQYVLSCLNKGADVKLEKKIFHSDDQELLARCYIQIAQNNDFGYLKKLKEEELLRKDKSGHTLLYYLIKLDEEITLDEILDFDTLKNPNIFIELKALGVSDISISIPTDISYSKFDCTDAWVQIANEDYAKGITSPVEDLLNELRNLFINDGKSDAKIVDALITSYRYTTRKNPIFMEEVKQLIAIKKKNPGFVYRREKGSGYFQKPQVVVENEIISTLNHETGHALHYFLTNNEVPPDYYTIVDSIRSNPDWIKKVKFYANSYRIARKQVRGEAKAIVFARINGDSIDANTEELMALLDGEKEKLKSIYRAKGYSEETLDTILSSSFTLEDFVKQKEKIEISELMDAILRYDYDAFIAIGDIIDAITDGRLFSQALRDKDGKRIPATFGHGIQYYTSDKVLGFDEMIANYSQIIKSKNSAKILPVLRDIVGDELVDLLDDFYKTKILKLPTDEKKNEGGLLWMS